MSNVLLADAFTYIFNMSITSCYIILAVLLVRFLICKMPKKYSYLLWSVVGFRLAVPISFKSVLSIFSLDIFDMSSVYNEFTDTLDYMDHVNGSLSRLPSVNVGIAGTEDAIYEGIMHFETQSSPPLIMTFQEVFSIIWIVVMLLLLIYGLGSYIFLRIRMSKAILKKGNVYESEYVSSPFILGIISPKIYIPFGLDEQTYRYIIAHEKCHLARYDYYVKAFAYILLAVHWFNPLCWPAFMLMSKDMEMSCDEKVLADNDDIKKDYSKALLSFAVESKAYAVTPLCFSENNVKKRIVNVLKFKKPKLVFSVLITFLCAFVILGCAANPKMVDEYIPSGVIPLLSKENIISDDVDNVKSQKNYLSDIADLALKELTAFEPFYCIGDFYAEYKYDNDDGPYIPNQQGNRFSIIKIGDTTNIMYTYDNGKSVIIYTGDEWLYLNVYIDNALYFNEKGCSYRIEFEYNPDGSIKTQHLSFVTSKYAHIVKAEENKLIISNWNYQTAKSESFELDTLSGKATRIDYNYHVFANDYDLKINADDAFNIAYEEIQDIKYSYWNGNTENMFSEYFYRDENNEPELICKPVIEQRDFIYERYPEFAWKVRLRSGILSAYTVEVYVNAQTGNVCSVNVYHND
ncbi:MAG: M56 family metallopeptidase [Eubacterium sp.]|nr:M56 family metallopeptidase [Eubacterium sp.]